MSELTPIYIEDIVTAIIISLSILALAIISDRFNKG